MTVDPSNLGAWFLALLLTRISSFTYSKLDRFIAKIGLELLFGKTSL